MVSGPRFLFFENATEVGKGETRSFGKGEIEKIPSFLVSCSCVCVFCAVTLSFFPTKIPAVDRSRIMAKSWIEPGTAFASLVAWRLVSDT